MTLMCACMHLCARTYVFMCACMHLCACIRVHITQLMGYRAFTYICSPFICTPCSYAKWTVVATIPSSGPWSIRTTLLHWSYWTLWTVTDLPPCQPASAHHPQPMTSPLHILCSVALFCSIQVKAWHLCSSLWRVCCPLPSATTSAAKWCECSTSLPVWRHSSCTTSSTPTTPVCTALRWRMAIKRKGRTVIRVSLFVAVCVLRLI